MSKIGDLFVRLGLKKDDFSKGIAEAKNETRGLSTVMKGVGKSISIAFAAVAASVAVVTRAINDLAKQNQSLGDAWGRITSTMTAMWDTFKTSLASTDFSHLFSNMREAGRLARELYDAYDALGEINTSYNISYARQLQTINELKLKLRDIGLTDKERLEAGEKLLNIYNELEKNPTRGMNAFSNANLDVLADKLGFNLAGATQQQLGATRKVVEDFMVWLGSETGEAFNSAFGDAVRDPAKLYSATVQAQNAGLPQQYLTMLFNYNKNVGDDLRETVEKAVTSAYRQQNKALDESMRVRQMMNSIGARNNGGGGGFTAPQEDPNAWLNAIKEETAERTAVMREVAEADAEVAEMDKQLLDEFHALNPEIANFRTSAAIDLAKQTEGVLESVQAEEQAIQDAKDKTAADLEDLARRAEEAAERFKEAVVSGFSAGMQELTDQLFGISEFNPGAIFQALMEPLADLAVREGEILMAQGIGIEACKEALESLNGYAAITAGAALIAIGAAAKSGLKALASAGTSSTGTYSSGYSSPGATDLNYQTELTVYVKGTLSGRDIVLSGQRTMNDWGR